MAVMASVGRTRALVDGEMWVSDDVRALVTGIMRVVIPKSLLNVY